jgi:serine/threonine-protein kinase
MELLTPLLTYTRERRLTEQDAARLGADICRALELCRRYNIIHRDIKPENIFVSDTGDFKLGDFGIARTAEKTAGGMSKKGTYTYMAPEVYRDEPYGPGVDIYSLGIVLYRLLNENRTPFLPDYPAPITHGDRDAALARRMGGEPLPRPKNGGDKFAGIVLKACACDPKDRYPEPETMRRELEALIEENTSAGGYLGEDDHSDDPSLPGDGETESAAAVPEEETSDETKSAMSETKSAAAPPAPKLKNRDVVRLVLISAAIILGSFIAAFIMAGSGLLLLGFLILVGGMVGTVYFLRGEKRKRNGTGTEKR